MDTPVTSYADATFGQFKVPVGWEAYNSSARLLLPERSLATTTFTDKRDIGLRVAKTFARFSYVAAVLNGSGQNAVDNNITKDAVLRLEVYPIKGMTIAGSAYGTASTTRDREATDRCEGTFRFEGHGLVVQSEYLRARDTRAGKALDRQGGYGALAYTLFEVLQPVARVTYVDADMDVDNDETVVYEAGLNYQLQKFEARAQLGLARFENGSATGKSDVNQLIAAVQTYF